MSYGYVQMTVPSLDRVTRGGSGNDRGSLTEEFELRLFCSNQQKIIGWIGEPLYVTVARPSFPPPLESLQVRFEGRNATLRWNVLDCGSQAPSVGVDCARLLVRTEKGEKLLSLEPDATEWELADLVPNTEYEFRVRLENQVGAGREAALTCRTNALCSATGPVQVAAVSTAHVELHWHSPSVLGNEVSKDRFLLGREQILRYEAQLRVEVDTESHDDTSHSPKANRNTVCHVESEKTINNSRKVSWTEGEFTKNPKEDTVCVRLNGLRPDTRYALDALAAVNSMGPGAPAKILIFWTIPLKPQIFSVRVRQGFVIIGLSQTGGDNVQDYAVSVNCSIPFSSKQGQDGPEPFLLPASNLSVNHDSKDMQAVHELSMPFTSMPVFEGAQKHSFKIRASNPGGWSEWSDVNVSQAVARQQGAEQAQLRLIRAIEMRRIEDLTRTIDEARDIELPDAEYFKQATDVLKTLQDMIQTITIQAKDNDTVIDADV
jgi:hypothetical protein